MPNLATTPTDVLHLILPQLSKEDHKNLRETCHHLNHIATGYVFHRIHISLLKVDRDAFFNIAGQSHLRQAVEELVWYDIPSLPDDVTIKRTYTEQGQSLVPNRLSPALDSHAIEESNEDLQSLLPLLANIYRSSLWLESYASKDLGSATIHNDREILLRDFTPKFVAAMEDMPRLQAFISHPAPYDKPISEDEEYPLNVGIFRQFNTATEHAGISVLLTALQASKKLDIRSLYIAKYHRSRATILAIEPSYATTFENLRDIDISTGQTEDLKGFQALAACLHAAKSLERLKLCFETESTVKAQDYSLYAPISRLIFMAASWPHLESVYLIDMPFKKPILLDFIENHLASLSYLRIQKCPLLDGDWVDMLQVLAGLPGLQLQSFYCCTNKRGCPREFGCDFKKISTEQQTGFVDIEAMHVYPEDWDEWPKNVFNNKISETVQDINGTGDADDQFRSDEDTSSPQGEPTYWVLDHKDGQVIFWSKTPQDWLCGYPTQMWKYVYRDGSFAFSKDSERHPTALEFFEDWDQAKGDIIEPTPYGKEFEKFSRNPQSIPFDFDRFQYPEHARVWLSGYNSEPLSQGRMEAYKRSWKDAFFRESKRGRKHKRIAYEPKWTA